MTCVTTTEPTSHPSAAPTGCSPEEDLGCGCFEAAPGCDGKCGSTLEYDACGVCGGDGSDDQGCGCFEDPPSGCDEKCGSTSEYDACEICGGIGITDQRCGCEEGDTPDFTCIPDDPSSFTAAIDSQKGELYVEKGISFAFKDLSENSCVYAPCAELGYDGCNTCDGTQASVIFGFEVRVIQLTSGVVVDQEFTFGEVVSDDDERAAIDFAYNKEISVPIISCGGEGNPPRFNEETGMCDEYAVWTGEGARRRLIDAEKCFSNVCAGPAEFDNSGEARSLVASNKYTIQVRSIACNGEYEDGTCTGEVKKGAFADYCYDDLVYNGFNTIDLAAEQYLYRLNNGESCQESDTIHPAWNKVEGTMATGIIVIDFNSACDSDTEQCVASCPGESECVYPGV